MKSRFSLLLALWIAGQQVQASIVYLNEPAFKSFTKSQKSVLVLIYEDWCGFSRAASSAMKTLDAMPEFQVLNIPIGMFNTHGMETFKKQRNITKVPIISLFISGTEIVFHGFNAPAEILRFVTAKTQIGRPRALENPSEVASELSKNDHVFLYFGNTENPRYSMFSEGVYQFPSYSFVTSDCPYVQDKYALKRDNIYYFKKGEEPVMYKRAYKRNRYLEWIHLIFEPKYLQIHSGAFEQIKKKRDPTLVLLKRDTPEGERQETAFKDTSDSYVENFVAVICKLEDPNCEEFLAELSFDAKSFLQKADAFMFVMTFHRKSSEPLYYFMRREVTQPSIILFLEEFANDKIKFEVISEPVSTLDISTVWKLTRNSFQYFFVDNIGKDSLILYHSSKHCDFCKQVVGVFNEVMTRILTPAKNSENLSAAHFDAALNGHEILKLNTPFPFARLYKMGSMENYHDLPLGDWDEPTMRAELSRFLVDTTTEHIDLGMFNEDF